MVNLPEDLTGRRVTLRVEFPDGSRDRVGRVLAVDTASVTLEDRTGVVHVVDRARIRLARVIPTVPRGRNPRHAPLEQLIPLAHDPTLNAYAGPCWIARLCDLIDRVDDWGVRRLGPATAAHGDSLGVVNGEWSALRLADAADLMPLAAWAARLDARNVVLTSCLAADALAALGLEQAGPG